MNGFTAGDILFILLVGALIWGIMFMVSRSRRPPESGKKPAAAPPSHGEDK